MFEKNKEKSISSFGTKKTSKGTVATKKNFF